MLDKISVIIPIFNVQKYLHDCLTSIIDQSYSNLEIILIDDGSTDGSLAICQNYQQQDSRIHVFHQNNLGTGSARNYGIHIASGKYIMFVDADDFIGPDHIKHLYQQIHEYKSDIACSLLYRMNSQCTYYFFVNHSQDSFNGVYTPQQWVRLELTKPPYYTYLASWAKLYKRSLFKNINFPNNSFAEDAATVWKLYLTAKRISFCNIGDYCYRIRDDSATKSKQFAQQQLQNDISALEERISFYNFCYIPTSFLHDRLAQSLNNFSLMSICNTNQYKLKSAKLKLQILKKYQ